MGRVPEGLWGAWRVHFLAAVGVAAVQLCLVAVTWLPGEPVLPAWLPWRLLPFSVAVFAVGAFGWFQRWGDSLSTSRSPSDPFFMWRLMARSVRLLRMPLRLALLLGWCVAVAGLVTALPETGRFEERVDGYYRIEQYGRELASGPVPVSDEEYARAQRAEQRMVNALPTFLSLSAVMAGLARLVRWDVPERH